MSLIQIFTLFQISIYILKNNQGQKSQIIDSEILVNTD